MVKTAKHIIVISAHDLNLWDRENCQTIGELFNAVVILCENIDKTQFEIYDNPDLIPIDEKNFLSVISKLKIKEPKIVYPNQI